MDKINYSDLVSLAETVETAYTEEPFTFNEEDLGIRYSIDNALQQIEWMFSRPAFRKHNIELKHSRDILQDIRKNLTVADAEQAARNLITRIKLIATKCGKELPQFSPFELVWKQIIHELLFSEGQECTNTQ